MKLRQWCHQWRYSCTYSYSLPYMEISFMPQLLHPQGNSLWHPLHRRLNGPRANLERTEVFCLCHELNHNSSSSLSPSHYTDWAILAPVKNIQKKIFLTKINKKYTVHYRHCCLLLKHWDCEFKPYLCHFHDICVWLPSCPDCNGVIPMKGVPPVFCESHTKVNSEL